MEGDIGEGWKPEGSWIVLDENSRRKVSSPQLKNVDEEKPDLESSDDKKAKMEDKHPDSLWFEDNDSNTSDDDFIPKRLQIEKFLEDDTYESETSLRLTPALGLQEDNVFEYNSMAQAERTLGLTISLDGVDSNFLKKSSQTIADNAMITYRNKLREQQHSPFSKSSVSSSEEEAQFLDNDPVVEKVEEKAKKENIIVTKSSVSKYGGRAPPILGALAPQVPKSSSLSVDNKMEDGNLSRKNISHCNDLNVNMCKSVEIASPVTKKSNKKISANELYPSCASSCTKSSGAKVERRRVRRRKIEKGATRRSEKAKKKTGMGYTWSYTFGFCSKNFNFKSVVPFVVSHVFTLLIGIYIGRKYTSTSNSLCQPSLDKPLDIDKSLISATL